MAGQTIRVRGIEEWRANLARLMSGLSDMADDVARESAQGVKRRARALTPVGPGLNGHARSSINVRGATVRGGSRTYPYFGWLDFGGRVGINRSVHRPYLRSGRIMFVAYRGERPLVEARMNRSLTSAARRAGL
jgi:hypothetical protein